MVEKVILLDFDGSTARVTPNRPAVRNALSMEMSDMLVEAIQTVERSTAVSFLAIEGAGNTFCGGGDITEMPRWGNDEHGRST